MDTSLTVEMMCPAREPAPCAARGRPRSCSIEERRAHLLETAETVFLTSGYHATTMDDVARRAGMSKRTVYQVFGSKAELFEALLNDRFCPINLNVAEDDRPLDERLVDALRLMAAVCLAPRQLAMMRLMIGEGSQTRDMADAVERLGLGRCNTPLTQWFAIEAAKGTLRPDLEPNAPKALFFTVFGEVHLHALLGLCEPPNQETIDRRIRAVVPGFLEYAVRATGCAPHPAAVPTKSIPQSGGIT